MTALGSQEWLAKATIGEMQIPIGVNEYDVRVKVFATNYIPR